MLNLPVPRSTVSSCFGKVNRRHYVGLTLNNKVHTNVYVGVQKNIRADILIGLVVNQS